MTPKPAAQLEASETQPLVVAPAKSGGKLLLVVAGAVALATFAGLGYATFSAKTTVSISRGDATPTAFNGAGCNNWYPTIRCGEAAGAQGDTSATLQMVLMDIVCPLSAKIALLLSHCSLLCACKRVAK